MPRSKLYPEGGTSMHSWVPIPVKREFERAAREQRQSASQLLVIVLEDYLRRRGYLRHREPEKVTA